MNETIVLTIPSERRFRGVATLVLGGIGSRLNLPYERMDDLQLALLSILDASGGSEVSIEVKAEDRHVAVSVGPLVEGSGDDAGLAAFSPSSSTASSTDAEIRAPSGSPLRSPETAPRPPETDVRSGAEPSLASSWLPPPRCSPPFAPSTRDSLPCDVRLQGECQPVGLPTRSAIGHLLLGHPLESLVERLVRCNEGVSLHTSRRRPCSVEILREDMEHESRSVTIPLQLVAFTTGNEPTFVRRLTQRPRRPWRRLRSPDCGHRVSDGPALVHRILLVGVRTTFPRSAAPKLAALDGRGFDEGRVGHPRGMSSCRDMSSRRRKGRRSPPG